MHVGTSCCTLVGNSSNINLYKRDHIIKISVWTFSPKVVDLGCNTGQYCIASDCVNSWMANAFGREEKVIVHTSADGGAITSFF